MWTIIRRDRLEERYVLQTDYASTIAEIDIGAPNVEVLETNILDIKELIAQIIGVEAESFPKLHSASESHFFESKDKKENPFAKLASYKKWSDRLIILEKLGVL